MDPYFMFEQDINKINGDHKKTFRDFIDPHLQFVLLQKFNRLKINPK